MKKKLLTLTLLLGGIVAPFTEAMHPKKVGKTSENPLVKYLNEHFNDHDDFEFPNQIPQFRSGGVAVRLFEDEDEDNPFEGDFVEEGGQMVPLTREKLAQIDEEMRAWAARARARRQKEEEESFFGSVSFSPIERNVVSFADLSLSPIERVGFRLIGGASPISPDVSPIGRRVSSPITANVSLSPSFSPIGQVTEGPEQAELQEILDDIEGNNKGEALNLTGMSPLSLVNGGHFVNSTPVTNRPVESDDEDEQRLPRRFFGFCDNSPFHRNPFI